jgi:hypothetical protein
VTACDARIILGNYDTCRPRRHPAYFARVFEPLLFEDFEHTRRARPVAGDEQAAAGLRIAQ